MASLAPPIRRQWAMTRASAASQASEYSPRQPWVMRPWRSTCVASTTSSPAPEFASMPRWVMCQSSATPSLALYWHIGETTMRFARLRSASCKGENRALVMERHAYPRRSGCKGKDDAVQSNRGNLQLYAQGVGELAHNTAAERQHPLAERGEIALHGDDQECAGDRPEHRAEAAQERHQYDVARHRPVHVGERGELKDQCFQRTGQSRQCRGEHESDELIAFDVVAERDGALLILADRLENLAERRVDDPVDQQQTGEHDDQNEQVHCHFAIEIENPEQAAAWHSLDAVLAAGEFRLQGEEKHHLRERQRDHCEIDALAANGEATGD